MLACIINTGIDFTRQIRCYMDDSCDMNASYTELKVISDGFFFFSTIMLYLILIGRCYLTFKDTQFEITNKTLILLSILITLSILYMIIYLVILQFNLWSITIINYIDGGITLFMSVNDIILNVSLLVLFINKLRELMINLGTTNDTKRVYYPTPTTNDNNNDNNDNNGNDNESVSRTSVLLDDKQSNLITIITRHTLLSCIAIIFNQIVYLLLFVMIFLANYSTTIDYMSLVTYTFRALDNVVIVTVLFLNFSFNSRIYLKLCGYCHMGFYSYQAKSAKVKIKRKKYTYTQQSFNSKNHPLIQSKTEPSFPTYNDSMTSQFKQTAITTS